MTPGPYPPEHVRTAGLVYLYLTRPGTERRSGPYVAVQARPDGLWVMDVGPDGPRPIHYAHGTPAGWEIVGMPGDVYESVSVLAYRTMAQEPDAPEED